MIGDYEDGMRSLKGAEELRKRTKKKKIGEAQTSKLIGKYVVTSHLMAEKFLSY